MLGKVRKIIEFRRGVRLFAFDVEGGAAKSYVDEKNGNWKRWAGVKVGDSVDGLEWFDEEQRIINADSGVKVLK